MADAAFDSFRARYAHCRGNERSGGDGAAEDALKLNFQMAVGEGASVPTVSERLERKFGLGQSASKRRELYRRLERLADREGERVLQAISEAVAQAVGARDPGRYFCKAVVSKIREAGFALGAGGGGDPSW